MNKSRRTVVVFTGLMTVLTGTSALLLAVAPAPLRPDTSTALLASDTTDAVMPALATRVPLKRGQWQYVYIRHANVGGPKVPAGGDHFVIGNGQAGVDGGVVATSRWLNQQTPTAPAGAASIDPRCISICLAGDFDKDVPTPAQMRRLSQLVTLLQTDLKIPATHVLMLERPGSAAAVGRYFPVAGFRETLRP